MIYNYYSVVIVNVNFYISKHNGEKACIIAFDKLCEKNKFGYEGTIFEKNILLLCHVICSRQLFFPRLVARLTYLLVIIFVIT